jgi:hypothetical protein
MSPFRTRFAPDLTELDERDVPAVIALPDYYKAVAGQVLEVPASRGLLANDFSNLSAEAVLTARLDTVLDTPAVSYFDFEGPVARILANPLPANTLTVNPDGSFRLVVPSNVPTNAQGLIFTYTAANALNPLEPTASAQVLVYLGRPTAPRFAVAPQAGAEPRVNIYEAGSGTLIRSFLAYEPEFTGGVRVALADLNADGVPDVITAPAEGGADRIKVFDGRTDRVLFDAFVFTPLAQQFTNEFFTGGAFIAAGDVNGDGFDDIIVGAGVGGGPRVIVINGQGFLSNQPTDNNAFGTIVGPNQFNIITTFDVLMDFFAYEPTYRGGVKVAAGDIAGVGRDFIITAPGFGGGPVVKTFDFDKVVGPPSIVVAVNPGNNIQTRQPTFQYGINANGSAEPNISFLAGDANRRDGVNIAAGDVNGDGKAEIITGTSIGPAVVSIFVGTTGGLINQFGIPYQQTPTGDTGIGANGLLGNVLPPSGLLLGIQRPNTLVPSQDNGIRVDGALIPSPNGNLDINSFALGGVTVGAIDFTGDGRAEILAGVGPGNSPRVRIARPDGSAIQDFLAFPANVLTGVFVG